MNVENKTYKTHIFKQATNKYLDKILPFREQDALNSLIHQIDDIVWKIATIIYTERGYKVDFSCIRDIANSRIEPLKESIAKQKAEDSKLKAELEAKRLEKIEQREHRNSKEKEYFIKYIGNSNMYDIYLKIKAILVDKLEIESKLISLDSHIVDDLGADDLDIAEIAVELEEKFNLKMQNDLSGYFTGVNLNFDCSSTPISGNVRKLLDYVNQQTTL